MVDVQFFDDVFADGAITEARIEAACVKIMQVAGRDVEEAKKADGILKDIILLGIADGRTANPQRCVEHYFSMIRAAFGEPTLLDQVKKRVGGPSEI